MRTALAFAALLLLTTAGLADEKSAAFRLNEEGIRLTSEGKFEEAIEVFTRARRLLPGDVTLRKNLAIARSKYGGHLLKGEKTDLAVKQYRLAASLDPGNAVHHANLGIALLRAGKEEDAKKSLLVAIQLDAKCAPAHAELGALHYKEGALEKAIEHWEIALGAAPDRKDVKQILAKAKRELSVERAHMFEDSAHFRVSWDGKKDVSVGSRILRILEDAYEKVASDLGVRPTGRVRVILYGEQEFKEVTGAQAWVGGLYDGRIRIPVKNFASAEREIRDTIFHEYTHVAINAVTKSCPAWLNEGLAQYFEGKSRRLARARVKRSEKIPGLMSLDDLSPSFARFKDVEKARLAYAQALSITSFLMDEHGPERITRFLGHLGAGKPADEASELAFHRSLKEI
ncbi:MAG: peptidase MA family metallohydrolase, partial [Planctomycetota bacterium]